MNKVNEYDPIPTEQIEEVLRGVQDAVEGDLDATEENWLITRQVLEKTFTIDMSKLPTFDQILKITKSYKGYNRNGPNIEHLLKMSRVGENIKRFQTATANGVRSQRGGVNKLAILALLLSGLFSASKVEYREIAQAEPTSTAVGWGPSSYLSTTPNPAYVPARQFEAVSVPVPVGPSAVNARISTGHSQKRKDKAAARRLIAANNQRRAAEEAARRKAQCEANVAACRAKQEAANAAVLDAFGELKGGYRSKKTRTQLKNRRRKTYKKQWL